MYPYRTVEELITLLPRATHEGCTHMRTFFREQCGDAPGSSHNHQTRKGGYFDHITDIMNYACFLYEQMSTLRPLPFSLSSALLVLFLHDIEKPIKYTPALQARAEGKSNEQIRQELIDEYAIIMTDEERNGYSHVHGEIHDYRGDARSA